MINSEHRFGRSDEKYKSVRVGTRPTGWKSLSESGLMMFLTELFRDPGKNNKLNRMFQLKLKFGAA